MEEVSLLAVKLVIGLVVGASSCYKMLWTQTFFLLSIFLDFIFLFLFINGEEACDISVT